MKAQSSDYSACLNFLNVPKSDIDNNGNQRYNIHIIRRKGEIKMANIEEKREELEKALSEISEEEMKQIVGGMSEKTKKYLILAGEIAGVFAAGALTGGLIGHNMGHNRGYLEGQNKVADDLGDVSFNMDNEKWERNDP